MSSNTKESWSTPKCRFSQATLANRGPHTNNSTYATYLNILGQGGSMASLRIPLTTWPPSGYNLATSRLQPGHFQATTWLFLGYHLATSRLQPGHFQATTWPPPGSYLQPGHLLTTFWLLSCQLLEPLYRDSFDHVQVSAKPFLGIQTG